MSIPCPSISRKSFRLHSIQVCVGADDVIVYPQGLLSVTGLVGVNVTGNDRQCKMYITWRTISSLEHV